MPSSLGYEQLPVHGEDRHRIVASRKYSQYVRGMRKLWGRLAEIFGRFFLVGNWERLVGG